MKPALSSLLDRWLGKGRSRGRKLMRITHPVHLGSGLSIGLHLSCSVWGIRVWFFEHKTVCFFLPVDASFQVFWKITFGFSVCLFFYLFFLCPTSVWIALKFSSLEGFFFFFLKRIYLFPCFASSQKTFHWSSHLNYNQSKSPGGACIEVPVVSPSLFPAGGGEDHPSYRLLSGAKEMLRRVIGWL